MSTSQLFMVSNGVGSHILLWNMQALVCNLEDERKFLQDCYTRFRIFMVIYLPWTFQHDNAQIHTPRVVKQSIARVEALVHWHRGDVSQGEYFYFKTLKVEHSAQPKQRKIFVVFLKNKKNPDFYINQNLFCFKRIFKII